MPMLSKPQMHASKQPPRHASWLMTARILPALNPSTFPFVCMQAGFLLSQWVFQGASMHGHHVSDFFKASLLMGGCRHPPCSSKGSGLTCKPLPNLPSNCLGVRATGTEMYSIRCTPTSCPHSAGQPRQPLAQLCAARSQHHPQRRCSLCA